MIQAPQVNYGMSQAVPQSQQRYSMAPSYNAVQINLDTPTLNAPPAMPYYPPVNMNTYQPASQAPVAPQPNAVPAPVLPQQPQVNIQPPAADASETLAEQAFKGLCSPDFDVQAKVMGDIGKKGIPTDGKPVNTDELVPYVQENIIDRLTEIMNFDSSKLAGPTEQQVDLRNKIQANEVAKAEAQAKGQDLASVKLPFELSEQEINTAKQLSPFEQAERNKEYAVFTTAILQKTYADAIQKAGDPLPPITELPGARALMTNLKANPSEDLRIAAIDAYVFLADGKPEYKNDVNTLLTIAQNDGQQSVADAATNALAIVNKQ